MFATTHDVFVSLAIIDAEELKAATTKDNITQWSIQKLDDRMKSSSDVDAMLQPFEIAYKNPLYTQLFKVRCKELRVEFHQEGSEELQLGLRDVISNVSDGICCFICPVVILLLISPKVHTHPSMIFA